MASEHQDSSNRLPAAIRALLLAGFRILGSQRHPRYIEIPCEKPDPFGVTVPYLVAITDADTFSDYELGAIRGSANRDRRHAVLVAATGGRSRWLSWTEFLQTLGGEVPSWAALSSGYATTLELASLNSLPPGLEGEAWALFEDLVASGLEFVLGRRAVRLGGRRRGTAVNDVQVTLPTGEVLVVDTKAAHDGFNANRSSLRPLVEYTTASVNRHLGHVQVQSALIVSSFFVQDEGRLTELSQWFYGETHVPVTFMTASDLQHCVECLRDVPSHRSGVHWRHLFTGGRFQVRRFNTELAQIAEVRSLE